MAAAKIERMPDYPTDDDPIQLFLQPAETRRHDAGRSVLAALQADCRTLACQLVTSGGHRSETVIVDVA